MLNQEKTTKHSGLMEGSKKKENIHERVALELHEVDHLPWYMRVTLKHPSAVVGRLSVLRQKDISVVPLCLAKREQTTRRFLAVVQSKASVTSVT